MPKTIAELEREVRRHNRLYFIEHRPKISDAEFDRLVEELKRRKPDSKVLSEIGTDVTGRFKKVRHEIPMLSLDKAYDLKTMQDWAEKFEGNIIVSPKIDGCAMSIRYDGEGKLSQAATRGNGTVGEDVTVNVGFIKDIPQNIHLRNVEVRGEAYMRLSVFARYKAEFANPRNLAAGAIKQKDPKKTGEYDLSFWAYDLLGADVKDEAAKREALKDNGFPVIEWKLIERSQIQEIFESYLRYSSSESASSLSRGGRVEKQADGSRLVSSGVEKLRPVLRQAQDERDSARTIPFPDYEMDGVVYKANLVAEQERLGATAHHPRFGIAYKFQGDSGVTTLKDVEWSVARTGVITPVGIVEPVELSGAMVSRVSLHNVGLMKKLGLSRGAKVMMTRRGGVIPNLESVVEPGHGKIEEPKKCPSCGARVELRDDFLYCTKPKECVQAKVGELKHFVQTVEIDGFGDVLLEKLYEGGLVTDVSEFYELRAEDLLALERMGDVLADKLVRNVAAKCELPLDVFLRSLGIRELGRHSSQILAREFGTLESVRKVERDRLSAIHTIGDVIADEVVQGLRSKTKLIDKLLKHINVLPYEKKKAEGGMLSGKSFLFTGTLLAMPRSEAEKLVEERGGSIASGVTKSLDYLVVGDGGGAGSKLDKAKKLAEQGGKVNILTEGEFLKITK